MNKYPLDNAGGRKFILILLFSMAIIGSHFAGKASVQELFTGMAVILGYYFGTKKNDTPAT